MGECFFVCYDSIRNELSCRIFGSVSQHAFGLQKAPWKRHDKQPAHERRRKRLQQQRHADSTLRFNAHSCRPYLVNKLYLFLSFAYTHTHTHVPPLSQGLSWEETRQTTESLGPHCDWLGECATVKAATPPTRRRINHRSKKRSRRIR